jgi:predicted dehydrogenase
MNFGIIGTGMIGSFHANAIAAMHGSTLMGVANRSTEKAHVFAAQHKTRAYNSVHAMLSDPAIDIVTIGTPSGAHLDPAIAAINAGKHVIIEKPLEITTQRIDQMTAAAKTAGVTIAAVLNRRFHPAMDALKKAVENNRFGRLTNASAYVKWYRDQAYYDSAGWRGTWALDGGGALMNQAIHTIDSLLYLAGSVKSVQANTACLAHKNIEVEDIAVAIIEFHNGARGVIEGSTCTWSKGGHPARVQLSGTEGSAFLADEVFETWSFQQENEEDDMIRAQFMRNAKGGLGANDPTGISHHQHQRNFEEVIAAINAGREPSTNSREARKSVELIQAIYQSAQNGGTKVKFS